MERKRLSEAIDLFAHDLTGPGESATNANGSA